MRTEIKRVGSSGQITLGKRHAGRTVEIEEVGEGVWVLRAVRVIPENEMWLHTPEAKKKLDAAIHWLSTHPSTDSDLEQAARKFERHHAPSTKARK